MTNKLRLAIRNDLEAPTELRVFGSGWLSGVGAIIASLAGLFLLLSWQYPHFFSMKELGVLYKLAYFSTVIQGLLVLGFLLACANLVLRRNRILGFSAICVVFLATVLGEVGAKTAPASANISALGLDWFVLNILLTGLLFVPLEKIFKRLN